MSNFLDIYDRDDSTTTLGADYDAQRGTWGVNGHEAYLVSTAGDDQCSAVHDWGLADGTIELSVDHISGTPGFNGSDFALIVRATDADNYLFLDYNVTNSTYRLYKKASASNTTIGGPSGILASPTRLKIIPNGSSIDCYADYNGLGYQQLWSPVTNTFNQTATKHGLFIYAGMSSSFWPRFSLLKMTSAGALMGGGMIGHFKDLLGGLRA